EHLRHADGQHHHAGRAHHRAFRAAHAHNGVELALAVELGDELPEPGAHLLDGFAPAARVLHGLDGRVGVGGGLRVGDVRHDADRLAEDARVDHGGAQAEIADAVAQVGDLGAFGVQRADDDDVLWHGYTAPLL